MLKKIRNKLLDNIEDLKYKNYIAKNYSHNGSGSVEINLADHTINVYTEFEEIFNKRKVVIEKYSKSFNITKTDILNDMMLSILLHDYGKTCKVWQSHCVQNNLRNVNLRHEFIYLFKIIKVLNFDELNFDEFYKKLLIDNATKIVPILAHHSNLSKSSDYKSKFLNTERNLKGNKDFIDIESEYRSPYNESESMLIEYLNEYNIIGEGNDFIKEWYKIAFNRHYLQLSDKRASINEQGLRVPDINPPLDYKLDEKWTKRNVQKLVEEHSKNNLLLIRASTGSGKSLAAILWSVKQIEYKRADRLIIAMPTQFTTNSLSKSISEDYGIKDVCSQHSNSKLTNENLTYIEHTWNKTLERNVTVCTIDHIINSLTLNNEEHHQRLFNIANSCIVIDESDFYDDFVHGNITKLLKITYELKIPVMFMSATLPKSYTKFLEKNTDYKNINIIDDSTDLSVDRVSINSVSTYKYLENIDVDLKDKLDKIVKKENAIIYCNTVNNATKIYNYLNKKIEDSDRVILYHSRYKEMDKRIIESKILDRLGKDAFENETANGIVIMTQIGELSINISSDYILTEISVFDRLIQRFGRGSRFNEKDVCEIDIIIPIDNNSNLYPAPYGEYDMRERKWIPNEFLEKSMKIINENFKSDKTNYSIEDYNDIVDDIYKDFDISNDSYDNSDKLLDLFKENIIFNSSNKMDEMENINNTIPWKVRNINEQALIYIGEPMDVYDNRVKWDIDRLNNSVGIYGYLSKIIHENGDFMTKTIKFSKNGEAMKVFFISDEYYSNEMGFVYSKDKVSKNNII